MCNDWTCVGSLRLVGDGYRGPESSNWRWMLIPPPLDFDQKGDVVMLDLWLVNNTFKYSTGCGWLWRMVCHQPVEGTPWRSHVVHGELGIRAHETHHRLNDPLMIGGSLLMLHRGSGIFWHILNDKKHKSEMKRFTLDQLATFVRHHVTCSSDFNSHSDLPVMVCVTWDSWHPMVWTFCDQILEGH